MNGDTSLSRYNPLIHDDPAMTAHACIKVLGLLWDYDQEKDDTGDNDEGHAWILMVVIAALEHVSGVTDAPNDR